MNPKDRFVAEDAELGRAWTRFVDIVRPLIPPERFDDVEAVTLDVVVAMVRSQLAAKRAIGHAFVASDDEDFADFLDDVAARIKAPAP